MVICCLQLDNETQQLLKSGMVGNGNGLQINKNQKYQSEGGVALSAQDVRLTPPCGQVKKWLILQRGRVTTKRLQARTTPEASSYYPITFRELQQKNDNVQIGGRVAQQQRVQLPDWNVARTISLFVSKTQAQLTPYSRPRGLQ